MLNDGTVLAGNLAGPQTYRYDPASNTWSADASLLNGDRSNEESWVKLSDGSILAYEIFGTAPQTAQRFVPGATQAQDQWVSAGNVPVALATAAGSELGSAFLLPDGRVFYIGATSNTALYTPPATLLGTGSWVAGPTIPNSLGANDAPAAMMPNGKVLFAASATPAFGPPPGTSLFEYDPVANAINPAPNVPAALQTTLDGVPGFANRMLVLPSGQILFIDSTNQPYVYTPDGGPKDAWRPAVTSVVQVGASYKLTGIQLTGISEGAAYGDDARWPPTTRSCSSRTRPGTSLTRGRPTGAAPAWRPAPPRKAPPSPCPRAKA